MDFTAGLNEAQKSAVLKTEGPLLIIAGAGAGKTKTVVHRIGHLIASGVEPKSILAVTFTNKAAKEMRERTCTLIEHLPTQISGELIQNSNIPFVSTFHRLGVFILRKFGAYGKKGRSFTILDDGDTMSLIKEAISSYGLDPKTTDPRAIKNIISHSANAFLSPEDLESEPNPNYRISGRIWRKYIELKKAQNALDFDDLLNQTLELLEQDEEVKNWCHQTWQYIHIDEYQDTNEVQYRLAKILADHNHNICVVGDSDQSIYSWRGAKIKNILEFEKDYPEAQVVVLEENYRSTQNVLAAANQVIAKNIYRKPKALFTQNNTGELISLYAAYDEVDEANFIVERCIEHLDRGGIRPSDIAVLFRTNAQSRALEEAFLSYGIPYQVLGLKFFERKEVKEVMSYLRAALNPESLIDIKKIINVPARGLGKVSVTKFLAKEALTGRALFAAQNFTNLLQKIREFIKLNSVSENLKFIIKESGLEEFYKKDPDAQSRLQNLAELVSFGLRYDNLEPQEGLERLVEDVALMSDQDKLENTGGVKLMTIHASKGLEFAVVFIAGLEQGLFPSDRDDKALGADAEEERRLMYVALTRAQHKLYLSYANIRTVYGMREVRMPSEFIIDIAEDLIQRETRTGEAGFGTVFL